MSKKFNERVILKHSDKWRTVLTDTFAFEVPLIISNDGFYKNLSRHSKISPELMAFLDGLIFEKRRNGYTVPLKYNIVKDIGSFRTLSLIHPHAQIEISDFYSKYNELICEYGSSSPFSIRKPNAIGGAYFVKSPIENKNKYKDASVDTNSIDSLVRNPASYFSYGGFDRLYKFFLSDDYVRLEKKFNSQMSLDIGKCFDSIYTHSIAWAVKDKVTAKESIGVQSFGNDFDKLMQRMNYNETSGISIGPEVCRIFAEVILARVDKDLVARLAKIGLSSPADFECRRYVDNYYVFANSDQVLWSVHHELSICLKEYKLHLNDGKTAVISRPFYTQKSLVIDKVNEQIQALWDKTLNMQDAMDKRFSVPINIRRHQSLFGSFTRSIKAACYASELSYDAVSNYIIGAMKRKCVNITEGFELCADTQTELFDTLNVRKFLHLLLDISFYFFTVHPTVASSLRLSHTIVLSAQHLKAYDADGFDFLKEQVLRWTSTLARSPTLSSFYKKSLIVPVELLNVLIALKEFSADGSLEVELFDAAKLEGSDDRYFQLVVKLFIFQDHSKFDSQRNAVFKRIVETLSACDDISSDAGHTCLLLDILACPYISKKERADLLRSLWPKVKLTHNKIGVITKVKAANLISELEEQHWFVRWEGIDLLNMIEKKELSAVYT